MAVCIVYHNNGTQHLEHCQRCEMTTIKTKSTVEDLLAIPRDDRRGYHYELIRGELTKTVPAGFAHSAYAINIAIRLGTYTERHELGRVVGADSTFLLATDPDHARMPDVGFVRRERVSSLAAMTGAFHGAPDLAVEVISPNDRLTQVADKAQDWLEHGTSMVVVVNPRNRTVQVHTIEGITSLTQADTLDGGEVVPGWSMPVADIFR